ncbi:SAM-dependent methyltransferase [uncultured Treponema sp.]|uniref:class I SAM-dependent methyltransferase n=1 Tax=uncultured Treponema sp. TaxID=162155 RepID=UPI002599D8DA|nr:SAM-dependent methyltransferase [uncultured Treponema sp.]
MIISATFSKPSKNCAETLGKPYTRIKIRYAHSSGKTPYFAESFTETQAFHSQMTEAELDEFIKENAGKTFKNCVIRTESEETTILANKKGEITTLKKKITSTNVFSSQKNSIKNAGTAMNILSKSANRTKNYLIPEGTPVPFLVLLGIMTPEGKIISSKYDKFRQINRFLEFLDDILPAVTGQIKGRTLRIADFGCGKSYLTFAVHYFLTEIKKIDAEIIGLDLKRDVIEYCSRTAERLNLKGLSFDTGNIADYSYKNEPDIVITLHACDTATDYAVKHGCRAILSVPCCQHELNTQLDENKKRWKAENTVPQEFEPLLKYGLIKERFASLATDALRAEYLEKSGYSVQILEFIDMEHTPKNLLIRALKKNPSADRQNPGNTGAKSLAERLNVKPKLKKLLEI